MFSISVPGPPIDRTPRAPLNPFHSNGPDAPAATAFIFGHIFDEFIHEPDAARPPPSSQDPVLPVPGPEDDEERTTAFEIPLNTLLDCLSVFGSASLASSASAKKKKGAGDGHESDGGGAGGRRGRDKGKGRAADVGVGAANPAAGNARLEQWFAPAQKDAGMRLSYAGPGHPLTLFMCVSSPRPYPIPPLLFPRSLTRARPLLLSTRRDLRACVCHGHALRTVLTRTRF